MGEQFEGSTGGKVWLAAIACGPAAFTLVVLVMGIIGALISIAAGSGANFPMQLIAAGALMGAMIGWPIMLFFGLPAHAFLYRRRSRKVGSYLLAGVLVGFVTTFIVLLLGTLLWTYRSNGEFAAGLASIGIFSLVVSVLASWLFWLIRRPDKDVARPHKVAAVFE
jgi:hypothetical protein